MKKIISYLMLTVILSSSLMLQGCTVLKGYILHDKHCGFAVEKLIIDGKTYQSGEYTEEFGEEHEYDYCRFTFTEDGRVTVTKYYDDSVVAEGTYEHILGKKPIFDWAGEESEERLTVWLDNGDVFEGSSSFTYFNKSARLYNDEVRLELNAKGCYEYIYPSQTPTYYYRRYFHTLKDLNDFMCSKDVTAELKERLEECPDNSISENLVRLQESYSSGERQLIIPSGFRTTENTSVSIIADDGFGLPWIVYLLEKNDKYIRRVAFAYPTEEFKERNKELYERLLNEDYVILNDKHSGHPEYMYYLSRDYYSDEPIIVSLEVDLFREEDISSNFKGIIAFTKYVGLE